MNVKILKMSGGCQCLCEEFMATGPSGSVTKKSTSQSINLVLKKIFYFHYIFISIILVIV